jgi:hypothetical protein
VRLVKGRVVVFTSTYAPLWNDLVLGPNALIAYSLQAYLAQLATARMTGKWERHWNYRQFGRVSARTAGGPAGGK